MFPQCGFSNTCVQILNTLEVPYETVNILEDEGIRQGMKEYSSWPTFPQIYIDGDFFGGCDIAIGEGRGVGKSVGGCERLTGFKRVCRIFMGMESQNMVLMTTQSVYSIRYNSNRFVCIPEVLECMLCSCNRFFLYE